MPWSMALQDDGGVQKIIVAGYTKITVKGKTADALRVDRFLSNGSPDTSFGSGGSVITQKPYAIAVAVQFDGKIVTAGELGQLVRLNANGSFDTSFGSGGTANGNSLVNPNAIAIQPDGKIVAAGYSSSKNKTLATVARFTSKGTVDGTFGSNGRVTADFSGGKAWDLLIAPDGSIIVGGTAGSTSAAQNAVAARFTPFGRLDASFGNGGIASFDTGTGEVGWRVGMQPNGSVLVVGNVIGGTSSTADLLTVRFDSAGNVDYSFGNLGAAVTNVDGLGSTSRGVFVQNIGTVDQPEYRILVAGMAGGGGQSYAVLARYIY
jgi:uncharacterized delta-60 repeat protein